ncbi:metallophosphoesterase family protein [Janthinobacterium fluminis]|uniref:Metallophosphoesterase family protein n=1 Tax=Janthinobacterium fluminis TaxID=2987524 RepID=A0ABT5K4X3_9BURK|nr:metallophosphoesterase family protein [Janthinobacterium fluminis]MDC8760043.1 metallophosphoesterase family protein [Janthinobacterium fluminis]
MRTLIHLSDLHFGRVDPALIAPLTALAARLAPDVVVVSGDLTQRARSAEFRAARAFLDGLPGPQIVVPGNHDVPLYNVAARFLTPLHKYRRHVCDDLSPEYIDDEIAVLGINTARSLTFKDGRVNHAQIDRVRARLDGLGPGRTKVIVTHHPFDLPQHFGESKLVDRAPAAMDMFAACGVDLLLAGHLHASHAGNTAARYQIGGYAALMVQAGTATSTRGRGESNSFNVLRIGAGHIVVERYSWDEGGAGFGLVGAESFGREGGVWAGHPLP